MKELALVIVGGLIGFAGQWLAHYLSRQREIDNFYRNKLEALQSDLNKLRENAVGLCQYLLNISMHPELGINPLSYEDNARRIFSSIYVLVCFYFPQLKESLARLEKTLATWHVVGEYATVLPYKERPEPAMSDIQQGLSKWIKAINREHDNMFKGVMKLVGRYARPD